MDIGTGDGRFVLEQARANPGVLCVGIDASQDGLISASSLAQRSIKKGGVNNARFVLSSIERLPDTVCDVADLITLNYPWGSLLSALVEPNDTVLEKIARMAKPGAQIRILLNWSVFENASYCERLGLPPLSLDDVPALLLCYRDCGLDTLKFGLVDSNTATTTWGKKLVKGSNRAVLSIVLRKRVG